MNDEKNRERLLELMTDQALFGLESQESLELEQLQKEFPDLQAESFEQLAAMIEVAGLTQRESLPDSLRDKIQAGMADFVRTPSRSTNEVQPATGFSQLPVSEGGGWRRAVAFAGWALAACLVIALFLPNGGEKNTNPVRSVAERRTSLIDSASDVILRDWQTTEDPAATSADGSSATGDVVWSNERQEGYLRIAGLQANDPTVNQYQLWIFDDDQEHPVDGGVFDIPPGTGEVLIPITAKINVSRPTVFAVTVEKPGGVVVSKQKRVPLLAPPA